MPRLLIAIALLASLASAATAATAQDLVGKWAIDGAATWAVLKTSAGMASLPADRLLQIEDAVTKKMDGLPIEITATEMITEALGTKKAVPYRVLAIDGDVVTIEGANDAGVVQKSTVTVTDGTLRISQGDNTVVMKKAPTVAIPTK
ncbi:MAG: hypothetical protein H0W83_06980 [Planctomycetes bacterium]|nr:hypothetical protein [Planctomycetota bacterium]